MILRVVRIPPRFISRFKIDFANLSIKGLEGEPSTEEGFASVFRVDVAAFILQKRVLDQSVDGLKGPTEGGDNGLSNPREFLR